VRGALGESAAGVDGASTVSPPSVQAAVAVTTVSRRIFPSDRIDVVQI
jgi:hypothetical protein